MPPPTPLKKLAKLLSYVLGRRPDEFALVPDPDGFVKIKDLLKALHAEEGLAYVRSRHLDEIILTLPEPPVEIQGGLIRAVERESISPRTPARSLPKLLYTCVRRKAYPAMLDQGRLCFSHGPITLSAHRETAEKLGRRIDAAPVLLTVHVGKAHDLGVVFMQAGETLYQAASLPAGCISGPPLPKDRPEAAKKSAAPAPVSEKTPGSFRIDPSALLTPKPSERSRHRGKDISWKKERKHKNRERRKMWPD